MSDGGADSLTQSLTESFTHSLSKENAGAGAECCQFSFQTLVQLVRMAPTVLYSGCKGQRAVGGGRCMWIKKFFNVNIINFEKVDKPKGGGSDNVDKVFC